MLECGDTFLAGDTEYDEFHLWVILTPTHLGEVVTVNFTTRHKRSDTTVIIKAGDHPFINNESVVAYRYARVMKVADIDKAIIEETAVKREKVSPALLKRVRAGLLESDHTENCVRHLYREFMVDEED
jgi:hypothetical protein